MNDSLQFMSKLFLSIQTCVAQWKRNTSMQALRVLANSVVYGARICCNSMSKYGIFSSTLSVSLLQWLFISTFTFTKNGSVHHCNLTSCPEHSFLKNNQLTLINAQLLTSVFLYEVFSLIACCAVLYFLQKLFYSSLCWSVGQSSCTLFKSIINAKKILVFDLF